VADGDRRCGRRLSTATSAPYGGRVTDAVTDHARAIPVLASLDTDETIAFYTDVLGFVVEGDEDYLIAKRDEMEIHFWHATDPEIPKSTSTYIRGGQIVDLYDEFSAREGLRISDFAVREWNMKEFYVWDPHGNLLKFGAAPEEIG
jgi:catechol 2,3-dioxygenase-like lactoylglutathione lyase family enzyme